MLRWFARLLRPIFPVALLAAAACGGDKGPDGADTADSGGTVDTADTGDTAACAYTWWYRDADDDGHGAAEAPVCADVAPEGTVRSDDDCDDTRADVYPGADEHCDGVDHDCDGLVDEDDAVDAPLWYIDGDEDGYGRGRAGRACAQEPRTSAVDGDCDDTDPDIRPGATEVCDYADVDEDCDGLADNADEDPEGTHPTWRDADGDGYGNPARPGPVVCDDPFGFAGNDDDCDDTDPLVPGLRYVDHDGDGHGAPDAPVLACGPVPGRVAVGDDCDDGDPAVFPGAPEDDCDDPVDYNCDGSAGYEDRDGDGVAACLDCDDGDPTRSPDAVEVCDGADDDCDGWPDDDPVDGYLRYLDADRDRYGDAARAEHICDGSTIGWVTDATDCDDTDPAVHPGAHESCTTAWDDDCDGDLDVVDAYWCQLGYADADGDAYGAVGTCVCVPADWGLLTRGGDCDDGDVTVHPGAEEACDATADADCDGYLGCAEPDRARILGDNPGLTLGVALALAGDQDGDGLPEVLVGSASRVAVARVAPVPDARYAGTLARLSFGDFRNSFGRVFAGGRDLDGDGWDDLYVAAEPRGSGRSQPGFGWILPGPIEPGAHSVSGDASVLREIRGWGSTATVAMGDDLTGDGLPDLVVGAPLADGAARESGVVAVVPASTTPRTRIASAPLAVHGDAAGDGVGAAVLVPGDVDGDGLADLLVGASGVGAVYLFPGPVSGVLSLADAAAVLPSASAGDPGRGLAPAGDLDGDGLPDVLVAFEGLGGVTWEGVADLASLAPSLDLPYLSLGPLRGTALAVGDVDLDGDGRVDLAAGVEGDRDDAGREGLVLVWSGPGPGSWTVDEASARVPGPEPTAAFGAAILGVPDPEGDGCDDLLVGAPGYDGGEVDAGEVLNSGAVWVLRGCGW